MAKTYFTNLADLVPLMLELEEQAGYKAAVQAFAAQDVPFGFFNHDFHLPYSDVCEMYERAAHTVKDPLFGARCAKHWSAKLLGPLGDYILQAPTLRKCLERDRTAISVYESGSSTTIEKVGDLVKWSYFTGFNHMADRYHYTTANIGLMLDIIRHYCGPEWLPDRIETDNHRDQRSSLDEFFETPVENQHAALSLIFPASDLDKVNPNPVSNTNTLTFNDVNTLMSSRPPGDSEAEIVASVVRFRLLTGLSDIEGASRHLSVGVRSLQRRLAKEGTNYRIILSRERYRRALGLIRQTELSMTDIALALGYTYSEDFTRAFTKMHGFPPSVVRHYGMDLREIN